MAAFITNKRQRRIKTKIHMIAQKEVIRQRMEKSLKSIGKGLSRTLTTMSESQKKNRLSTRLTINDIHVDNFILPFQKDIKKIYDHQYVQVAVAAIIFTNFVCSSAEKQIIPAPGSIKAEVFFYFENFFCYVFLFELLINMYGSFFYPFWKSAWNCFDFLIVVIAFMALYSAKGSGISILRLFRAFRVFRLFKRIQTLRCIIEGVIASLPGVFNAFVILGLIMGIWSIIGVAFFGSLDIPESRYFRRFGDAMFTLWQCMTMDSWASDIARPLIQETHGVGYVYFVSYIFVSGIVLSNVVVAILLEKYLAATKVSNDEMEEEDEPDFDFHENLTRSCEAITEAVKNHTIQALDLALKASGERFSFDKALTENNEWSEEDPSQHEPVAKMRRQSQELPLANRRKQSQILPPTSISDRKRAVSCVSPFIGHSPEARWDFTKPNNLPGFRPEITWGDTSASPTPDINETKPSKLLSGKLNKIAQQYSTP